MINATRKSTLSKLRNFEGEKLEKRNVETMGFGNFPNSVANHIRMESKKMEYSPRKKELNGHVEPNFKTIINSHFSDLAIDVEGVRVDL